MPRASRWPKSICRPGCISTTPPIIVRTVAGMTPTPQLASVEEVSPSAHDSDAAWRLTPLNGTTAAGSRAGSVSATKRRARKPASVNRRASVYLGTHDLAAPDDLSRFGAHGPRLQRHSAGLAIHDP